MYETKGSTSNIAGSVLHSLPKPETTYTVKYFYIYSWLCFLLFGPLFDYTSVCIPAVATPAKLQFFFIVIGTGSKYIIQLHDALKVNK